MKINYLNLQKIKKYLSIGVVLWVTTYPAIAENGAHRVKRGETLGKIAFEYYGKSSYYDELAAYNNISNPDLIRMGTILEIPTVETLMAYSNQHSIINKMTFKEKIKELSIAKYGTGEYISILAKINGVDNLNAKYDGKKLHVPSFSNLKKYIDLLTKIEPEDVLSNYYFVENGDTLSKISYTKYGNYDYVDFLVDINALENKNLIHVGELLYVPGMYVDSYYKTK